MTNFTFTTRRALQPLQAIKSSKPSVFARAHTPRLGMASILKSSHERRHELKLARKNLSERPDALNREVELVRASDYASAKWEDLQKLVNMHNNDTRSARAAHLLKAVNEKFDTYQESSVCAEAREWRKLYEDVQKALTESKELHAQRYDELPQQNHRELARLLLNALENEHNLRAEAQGLRRQQDELSAAPTS